MLRPARLLLSFVLLSGTTLFAQDGRSKVKARETPAMHEAAKARTMDLDKVVSLTKEQKEQVQRFYLDQEKMKDAMVQRYDIGQVSAEDRKINDVPFHRTLAEQERASLGTLLTAEQFAKYDALKKVE